MSIFGGNYDSVSDLAINSIATIYSYLDFPFNYNRSSVCSPETKGLEKADWQIEIAKGQGYKRYVNALGGKSLYNKEYFEAKGIELDFVESEPVQYKQYSKAFVPGLSIIDV